MTGATTKMENPMPLNTGKTGKSPTGFGAANKSTDHENALDGTNPKSHEFPSSATKYVIVAKSIQEIDATTSRKKGSKSFDNYGLHATGYRNGAAAKHGSHKTKNLNDCSRWVEPGAAGK